MRDLNDLTDIYATAAEEGLISSVIIDENLIYQEGLDTIPPGAFSPKRAPIWKAVLDLYRGDQSIDLVTVTEQLRLAGKLHDVGGVEYVMGILSEFPGIGTSAHTYADQVEDVWTRRRIARIGLTYAQRVNRTQDETATVVEEMERELYELSHSAGGTGLSRASDIADEYTTGGARLSSGFPSIDRVTSGGLPLGDLTVLAGRTSMGKSALAHAIAFAVGDAHVISPDQPLPEVIANEACRRTRIPLDLFQITEVSDKEKKRWRDAKAQVVKDMSTTTFDDGSYKLGRAISDIRRAAFAGKKLVIVDHLQRIFPDKKYTSRREFMIDVTGTLKDLARDFGISILALSQLSRAIDERPNKRPMLADLSESKSIEEDANLVLFLYREKYYDPNTMQGDVSEVIVAKNKTGGRYRVAKIAFRERFVLFEEFPNAPAE